MCDAGWCSVPSGQKDGSMAALEMLDVEAEASTPRALRLLRPGAVPCADRPTEDFGDTLHGLCVQLAGITAEVREISLACTVDHHQIPGAIAAGLRAIALGLIASAYNSFHRQPGWLWFHVAAILPNLTPTLVRSRNSSRDHPRDHSSRSRRRSARRLPVGSTDLRLSRAGRRPQRDLDGHLSPQPSPARGELSALAAGPRAPSDGLRCQEKSQPFLARMTVAKNQARSSI